MLDNEYFDQYSTLIESKPEFYASIEIRGVKDLGDGNCVTDDDNPDFFSAYTRDHENLAYCIADAGLFKLEQLRATAKDLAFQYNWEYQDFTHQLYCLKCGNETEVLHEGYCEDCCNEGQRNLNDHIARHDAWEQMPDQEKDALIKSAACVF